MVNFQANDLVISLIILNVEPPIEKKLIDTFYQKLFFFFIHVYKIIL